MRTRQLALALLVTLALAAPAWSGGQPTLDSLLKRRGPDVVLTMGTSDYAVGSVRVSFLVIRNSDGKPIYRPTAHVWVGAGPKAPVLVQAIARLEPVGVPGGAADAGEVTHLYVATFRLSKPGTYRIVAEPIGGPAIQGFQDLTVKAHSDAPGVGDRAIASDTPTLASTRGNLAALTTRVPPDRALLRYSIADSLKAHAPFVVVFATPKFCTSRTCGPVVDVVDAVRKRYEARGIRFIHVEIYQDNDPSKGPNRWVREWHLPSEPFIFLVGRDGRIKAKFEGSVSVDELGAAVAGTLLR